MKKVLKLIAVAIALAAGIQVTINAVTQRAPIPAAHAGDSGGI